MRLVAYEVILGSSGPRLGTIFNWADGLLAIIWRELMLEADLRCVGSWDLVQGARVKMPVG